MANRDSREGSPWPALSGDLGGLNQRLAERIWARTFVYRHDRNGVFTWLSPSVHGVLGYSPEEILTNYHDYLTDHSMNREVDRYTELGLRGIAQPPYDVEIVHKDGTVLTLEVVEIPLFDEEGAVIGLEGMAQDVTARREARRQLERLLEDKEQLLAELSRHQEQLEAMVAERTREIQTLIANVPGVVFRCDVRPSWRFEQVSPYVENLTGRSVEDLLSGRVGWHDIVHPDDWEAFLSAVQDVMAARGALDVQLRMVRTSGEIRWVHQRAQVLHGLDGSPSHLDGVMMDITERFRAAESLQRAQKLESIGVLAGGIAHDFNNLLSALFGHLQLARLRKHDPETVDSHLSVAESAFEQARALTRQLLTFAKGGDPIVRLTSLSDVVERSARMAVSGSSCRLDFDLQEDLWPCAVDEHQVGQVINNLCINAVQAMPAGGTICVRARNRVVPATDPDEGDVPRVRLEVTDQGAGIAAEVRDRIFEPFYTTKTMGSGLGLATCYSILKKHGGSIEVTSTPGYGATFAVWLPARPGATLPPKAHPVTVPRGSGSILVMDDEPSVLAAAVEMLQLLGYETRTACEGEEAVALYRRRILAGRGFDAVIVDLTVPAGVGGLEALARLRDIDPNVCAIASSGYSDDPVMAQPASHGFCGSLAKPYRQRDLGIAVAQALERRKGSPPKPM
jgi:PAS domain S-box-containing protein